MVLLTGFMVIFAVATMFMLTNLDFSGPGFGGLLPNETHPIINQSITGLKAAFSDAQQVQNVGG